MRLHFRARDGLLWVGLAAFGAGFAIEHLWQRLRAPSALLLALGLLGCGVGGLLARRLRWRVVTSTGLVWLACLVGFAGPGPVTAVLLMGAAAAALGSVLVDARWAGRLPLSIMAGLALMLGVDGWLLPLPLHTRAFYLVGCAWLVAWRFRVLAEMLQEACAGWRSAVASAPRPALVAVACVGVASTCAWFPAIFYDAMGYHLALPTQLARYGYYQMNVGSNVWALAPWMADVAQGIAWVLAGGEATGSVGMLWLIPTLALVWQLGRLLEVPAALRWIGVALYAGMPLVAGLLTTMQTELPTAAVLAALTLAILQRGHHPDAGVVRVVAVLSALLMALKVSNILFVLPSLAWLLWRCRGRLPWKALPLAFVGAILLAGSSYAYAYVLAGNPVLPVFNAFFKSPYFPPIDFHDARWDRPLGWLPPWPLVFHSSAFAEAGDGTGPFVLVALAGSWLCALAGRRSRGLAFVGAVCLALPLTQVHYLRYAMPAMVVLVPAMLAGLPLATDSRAWRMQVVALAVLAGLSVLFVPRANWQMAGKGLATLIKDGRHGVLEKYAPERLVADFVFARGDAGDRILLVSVARPFTAMFAGMAYTTAWYDMRLNGLLAREGLARTVAHSGANLLLVPDSDQGDLLPVLRQHDASVVFQAGDVTLWQLRASPLRGSNGASLPAGGAAAVAPDLARQRDLALRLLGRNPAAQGHEP
jgi:hypothetical protein